jgi:rhodanese-related sulfurtransferase
MTVTRGPTLGYTLIVPGPVPLFAAVTRKGESGTTTSRSEQNHAVQADEFSKRRSELHLLDVREDDEWTAGHIDGAQHIPLGQLAARLGELPKDRTIVAVCRSGGRSEAAVRGLRKLGYEAENLEGGVNAWDRAKLPLVDATGGRGRVI